jgi:hypothetical protein
MLFAWDFIPVFELLIAERPFLSCAMISFPRLVVDRMASVYCSSIYTAVPMMQMEQGEWVESFPFFISAHQDPPTAWDVFRLAKILEKAFNLSNPRVEENPIAVYSPEDPAIGAVCLWTITWFKNRSVRLFPEIRAIQRYPDGDMSVWTPALGQSFIEPPASFSKMAIRIACPGYKKVAVVLHGKGK